MTGFTDGDSCFRFNTRKSPANKSGISINLCFIITQHIRDLALIQGLVSYFNCGGHSIATDSLSCEFHIYRTAHILYLIIPFFLRYPLQGAKSLYFSYFSKAADILRVKGHLTEEGLHKLLALKEGMNDGRGGGVKARP